MKPSDLFGVIVRTIGLLAIIQGVWYSVYAFLQGAGVLSETEVDETKMYLASGIPLLCGGCLLLRGADWFVKFSYPETETVESIDVPTEREVT
jgi:hypothetical protein